MTDLQRATRVCGSTVAVIGREHLRLPSFSVPTLTMPVLLYLFFGVFDPGGSGVRSAPDGALELLGYCGFAVLGVALFSFGAGVALDRVTAWEQFQRTLPVSALVRYVARLAVVLTFSAVSLLPLLAAGLALHRAPASVVLAPANLLPLLLGMAVFCALGTALGYWLPPRGAVPLTNLVYLPLSYAGGLFGTSVSHRLDRWAVLPTTEWNDLLYATAVGAPVPTSALLGLLGWFVGLTAVALVGYHRVQRESFG